MTPQQIFARMDGMLGYMTGAVSNAATTTRGNQSVEDWVRLVKVLLTTPNNRYLDDFEFDCVPSVTDAGVVVSTSATDLLGGIWEVSGDLGTDTQCYVFMVDSDADTIDATAAMTNATTEKTCYVGKITDLVTSTVPEYYPFLLLAGTGGVEATAGTYAQTGVRLTTGLIACSDGNDGNATTAASLRVWVLYRT